MHQNPVANFPFMVSILVRKLTMKSLYSIIKISIQRSSILVLSLLYLGLTSIINSKKARESRPKSQCKNRKGTVSPSSRSKSPLQNRKPRQIEVMKVKITLKILENI